MADEERERREFHAEACCPMVFGVFAWHHVIEAETTESETKETS
jgi:hypothetical protein